MNLYPLSAAGAADPAITGGKGASLAQLIAWGLPVPEGFVVTTAAYAAHASRARERGPSETPAARPDGGGVETEAARAILETPIDAELAAAIVRAWRELGAPPVAVRSSATAEDLASASFAGQHDSFLEIAEPDALVDAVKRCWASLWSERAVRYRAERGIAPDAVTMAVVVQRMVPAMAAGVAFTVDPLTQRRDRMSVEVVRGLGEALVSGRVRGESCLLDRTSGSFRCIGAAPLLLGVEQRKELGRLALQIEARAGAPQDIEFAVADGRVAILQARPITTLGEPVPEPLPLRYIDRRMQHLTLERYAIAPRPLDNTSFVRMVGAAAYAAQQFGLQIDAEDHAAFRRTLWHQQYRFPRSRITLRLLLHPILSFGMLRQDWLGWWQGEPRRTLGVISAPVELSTLGDAELFERADHILEVWSELTNRRFYAVSSVHAESYLQMVVTLAVGPKAAPRVTSLLLSGIASHTGAANDALWELSRIARADPAVAAAIRAERWEAIPAGHALMAGLRQLFEKFGHRESGGFYLSQPTWRHDPGPVRRLLRSLLDAEQRPMTSTTAHDEARKRVERRLWWFPWLRRRFAALLEQVCALHRMREESHHDLTRPLDALQSIVAELGRRLRARGLTEAVDDIHFLTYEEIRDWMGAGPPAGVVPKEFIARRRATYRHVNARWQRNRPQPKAGGRSWTGVAASPGRVRGVARIVLDETQFDRLRPGEVLVCPHSNPSWTPLFLTAVAVVSETGGAASHAAIVAREYGLPAVLAVTGATQLLRDGEVIEVDGDRGRVTRGAAATAAPKWP